nr:transcription factor bye1-like [Aedes albopictus]
MASGGTPSPTECSCANCDRPNTVDDLVQCDRCKAWWHMSCAGVTHSVEGRTWHCSKCVSSKDTSGSVLSVPSSSRSRSTSRSKRARLVLQKLQEEQDMRMKQLKEQQDMEKSFLERKYALIEAALEEEEDDDNDNRSRSSHRSNVKKTQQWVNEVAEANKECAVPPTKVAGPAAEQKRKGAIPKQLQLDFIESTPHNAPNQPCHHVREDRAEQNEFRHQHEFTGIAESKDRHGPAPRTVLPAWPNTSGFDMQKEMDTGRPQFQRPVEYPGASSMLDVRPSNPGKLDPKPPRPVTTSKPMVSHMVFSILILLRLQQIDTRKINGEDSQASELVLFVANI